MTMTYQAGAQHVTSTYQIKNFCGAQYPGQVTRTRYATLTGFPLGLENLENLEKWEGIFQSGKSQGILNRLEKSGKSQGKSHKILEN